MPTGYAGGLQVLGLFKVVLMAALALVSLSWGLVPAPANAHGGRTDKNGCHVQRSIETYHCHDKSSLISGQGALTPTRPKKGVRPQRGRRPIQAIDEARPLRPTISRGDGVCACSRQARCTGPRGGVYCLNATGNKRYFSGKS
jgi:hypothetical protein